MFVARPVSERARRECSKTKHPRATSFRVCTPARFPLVFLVCFLVVRRVEKFFYKFAFCSL